MAYRVSIPTLLGGRRIKRNHPEYSRIMSVSSSANLLRWLKRNWARNCFTSNVRGSGWVLLGSGEWIRTTDLRFMSSKPESVPFVRRVLQISQTCEQWFLRARHTVVIDLRIIASLPEFVKHFLCVVFIVKHSLYRVRV